MCYGIVLRHKRRGHARSWWVCLTSPSVFFHGPDVENGNH